MEFFTDENYEKLFKKPLLPALYVAGDTVFGKYLIKGTLHGGYNSDVYKATDILRNRDVVIKYVKGSAFDEDTSKIQNHAVEELRKWSSIPCHNGIVPVLDGFYDMRIQKFAIVSPFIETTHSLGLTLAELLENGYKFTKSDAEFLICEVYKIIAGLKKSSGNLYVHKDIRPENIFIVAPKNSDKFTDCTLLLADCGSYSSFVSYLPSDFKNLLPPARDVYMLISTAKKLCSKLPCTLAEFCESLGNERTMLDFEKYFGTVQTSGHSPDCDVLESLVITYNGFTFTEKASEKSSEAALRFNDLCREYADKYHDSVLPMFLTTKDSQHCDRHDDALKRLEIIAAHTDLWDSSNARLFCEYSSNFSAEMLITLAVSAFYSTDLFNASADEKNRLCSLFKEIELEDCFDLSFLECVLIFCEFMLVSEGDKSLLNHFSLKTSLLADTDDNASPQLVRDRRMWKNVFACMSAATKEEKSRYAHDTAELLNDEPYNPCYLFYTAKLFMLSSEFTIAKPYCFLTADIIDCVFNHTVQKDISKTLLYYQTLTSYWTGSFDLAQYYCKKGLALFAKDTVFVPGAVAMFNALYLHIEKEKDTLSSGCANISGKRVKISNLYNVAERMKYISLIPGAITAETRKSGKIDIEKIKNAIDELLSADKDLPEAAYMSAQLYALSNDFEQAEGAIKDYCIKMRFSFPENPFNRDDERNEMHKTFYSQIKKETSDSLNTNVTELENQAIEKTKENDYGTDTYYY